MPQSRILVPIKPHFALTQPNWFSLSFETLSPLTFSLSLFHTHALTKGKRSRQRRACSVCLLLTQINNKKWKTFFSLCFASFFYTISLSFSVAYYISTCFRFTEIWDELSVCLSVSVCVWFSLLFSFVHLCVCLWVNECDLVWIGDCSLLHTPSSFAVFLPFF